MLWVFRLGAHRWCCLLPALIQSPLCFTTVKIHCYSCYCSGSIGLGLVYNLYEQRSLSIDTLWLHLTLIFWQPLRQPAVATAERSERAAAAALISMHSCLIHSKFMMVQLSAVARCVTMATEASETKEDLVFTVSEFTELFTSLPAENTQINAEKWYSTNISFKVCSFLGQQTSSTLNICII